jgi:murein DD-endopeptidase MepM/ murein hydrolase activator NlpD
MASVRSQPLPPPQSAVALRNTAPLPAAGNASGWSAQGGTPVVVAQGETLDMISSRYGVPRAALISANGLSSPNIAPGSRLTIPVYNANAGSAPAPRQQFAQSAQVQSDARPEPARNLATPNAPPARIAAPAMPASATARAKAVAEAKASAAAESKATEAAQAKTKAATDAQAMRESRAKFAAEAKAKAEARKTTVAAAPVAPVANVPAAKPVVAEVKKPAPEKPKPVVVASAPAVEPKVTAVPKAAPEPVVTASLPKPAAEEPASDKADFRWPARGRVISGYSGKGGNEGINIAVPEGTPVKAAEGGTVAYAGSELKGYGNLVLIRHPNGYVSAYAHNGDLKVKRGDTVKRGQVVANSGQSGNVSSPQLHFELRKGSAPVDPTPYLTN